MLNLSQVSGVKSTPLSKDILESSIGLNQIKDSKAFSNYEFMLDTVKGGAFKAPSVLLASGDGKFHPKSANYQNSFYSSHVLGRNGYKNIWQSSFLTNNDYAITYYDGSTLFRRFNIDDVTGTAKVRSLEVRNGNISKQAGYSQLVLGYNSTANIDENGIFRHSLRTRHDKYDNNQNAIDLFLWDKNKDADGALGSRRVLSLYGTGNLELVNGTHIDSGVSVAVKSADEDAMAISGKGVLYYNQTNNRYRYSEDGGAFKYLGSGSGGGSFYLESCNLNKCSFVDTPVMQGDKQHNNVKSFSFVVRMYSHAKAKIKKIYVPARGGAMQVAVYSDTINEYSENGPFRYTSEQLIAYNPGYSGRNAGSAGSPYYLPTSVALDAGDWEFYERNVATPSTTVKEAIVSGSFAVAISVNWDATETIEKIMAELISTGFADPSTIDDLVNDYANNGMNFESLTYDMTNDTNPTTSSLYTMHASISDRVSMYLSIPHFIKQLNFVPYIKVVLEPVEE